MKHFIYILIFLFLLGINLGLSQQDQVDIVPISMRISGFTAKDLTIRVKESVAYLPAIELLDYVGIWARYNSQSLVLEGFYRKQDSTYTIDAANKYASINKTVFSFTDDDFIIDENKLYLKIDFINEFFGLDFKYNPNLLRISMRSYRKLPAYQYQRLVNRSRIEQLRSLLEIPEPDFTLERENLTSGAGIFNHYISTNFRPKQTTSLYNFFLGSKLLGNDLELNVRGLYSSKRKRLPVIRGIYRIPIINSKYVSQIIAGRTYNPGLFPLDVYSLEFTNRPIAQRYVQTSEQISDQIIPNSVIRVVGGRFEPTYVESDSDGNFAVDFPTFYGKGGLEVRGTDRYGRVEIKRYQNNVPYVLLPQGETEYSVYFGKVYNVSGRFLSVNSVNYGISSKFTLGGRLEYYDMPGFSQKTHLALTTVGRISRGIYISGLVSPKAYSQVELNWLPSSDAEISLTRAWYSINYRLNYFSLYDKWEATLNIPFLSRNVRLSTNASRYQFSDFRDFTLSGSLRGYFRRVSAGIGSRITWRTLENTSSTKIPYHFSDAVLGSTLPFDLSFQSQITYDHVRHELNTIGFEIQRLFFNRLNVSFFYQRYPSIASYFFGINLRYYFPFLRVGLRYTRSSNNTSAYNLYSRGSVLFSIPDGSISFDNKTLPKSYGGFIVRPFYDENNNSVKDPGESYFDRGKIYYQNKTVGSSPSSLPRNVFTSRRLSPYNEFNVYFEPRSLDDPLLVPRYSSIRMISEANYLRNVDIPIVHSGTIRGSVHLSDSVQTPVEGINVLLYTRGENGENVKVVKRVTTFSTGEFEFDLLPPKTYIVEIDPDHLQQLFLKSQPARREVTIRPVTEGDIVDGVKFVLTQR